MENQKWQYMRDEVDSDDEADEKLAHWGSLGWELVTAQRKTGFDIGNPIRGESGHHWVSWHLIFKMPIS